MPLLSAQAWEALLERYPDAHILQTAAWGELKGSFGWNVVHIAAADGRWGAQVLFRPLPFGLSIAYIPRGPLGKYIYNAENPPEVVRHHHFVNDLMTELDKVCRQNHAILLKVEPDTWELPQELAPEGFRHSMHSIQPTRTLVIDLAGSEDSVLARMKQKTRYNIRLSQKRGVVVRQSSDLGTFHHLMEITGGRDRFGVHSQEYYRRVFDLFEPAGQCVILQAEIAGQPLAALMAFMRGQRAWYLYGASSDEYRELMSTYLLQWEAIRWARSLGCTSYDLWGVPDADEKELEAYFPNRSDDLWGVYRFKRGFGGKLLRSSGPWDRIYNPVLYKLYAIWIARRGEAG